MPVRKFRSVDEMKRGGTWRAAGTPELWRAIALVWDFGRRTAAVSFPPGVYRHPDMESLNALTERWAAGRWVGPAGRVARQADGDSGGDGALPRA